jgi:hypothetical protein
MILPSFSVSDMVARHDSCFIFIMLFAMIALRAARLKFLKDMAV